MFFFYDFSKGDNFCEFLFPSLDSESLQKEGLVLMERICSMEQILFLKS